MTTTPGDAALKLAEEVGIPVNGPKPDRNLVSKLTDAILKTEHFAVDVGYRLCRYDRGVYRPDGDRLVKRRVKELLGEWALVKEWSSHKAEEVAKYFLADAREIPETPPTSVLSLLNGLLDISTLSNPKLMPHSPEHFSLVQLPIAYDPDAECPELNSFITEAAPDDCFELALEILGVLLVPRARQALGNLAGR